MIRERFSRPLREYQLALKTQLEESVGNTILQMPTGTGKGNVLVEQCLDILDRDEDVLVVVPSIDLIENLTIRFKEASPYHYNVNLGVLGTGYKRQLTKRLTIGIYKSVYNARYQLRKFKYVIHDEVQHCMASTWKKLIEHFSDSIHYGYTATPTRLDGKPLNDNFGNLILAPQINWFIQNKYLSPYKLYSAANITLEKKGFNDSLDLQDKLYNTKGQIGKAVDQWRKFAYGTKTIVFATSIAHAYALAHEFNIEFKNETVNGKPIRFVVLESNLKSKERNDIKQAYISGEYMGIVNVSILTEGVDIPDVETVLLCRYTFSLALFYQMIGRALRYVPGKYAKILDVVGNALKHGSPSMEQDWEELFRGSKPLSKDYMCCCEVCDLPLITKSKVARFGKGGVFVTCPNCDTENFFEIIPKNSKKRLTDIQIIDSDLIEFTADSDTMKLYNILKSKKKLQDKIMKVVNLNDVDDSLKMKALRTLDLSENAIEIYLGI